MMSKDVDKAADAAVEAVAAFVAQHRAAAIPALIGACVMWGVDHGARDLIEGSLRRAIKLAEQMDRVRGREMS